MASLTLNHIYKVYPNGVKAVNDFTMEIKDKEFIVFVGPSGCGKSTTLRMIAGLEEITSGELKIGDIVVNDMEPKDRDIAMVFQNYALYPHMTVYNNMAFGLKLRKMPKDEIDRRVREAANILGITEYLNRKPKAMSGGQRQRVALGRAIVREPKVFLLDEPLSNLDAKLRATMRSEISKLHHKLQTTFIYVTHDQVEAMTMGTRIVVMKDGFVQQIDTPRNLYNYPCNKFVAGFIGTPQMNFFESTLKLEGDTVKVAITGTDCVFDVPYSLFAKADRTYLTGEKKVVLGIRAEHISVDPNKYPYQTKCRISHVEELGVDSQVYADFNLNSEDSISDSATKVIIKAPTQFQLSVDEVIDVSLDMRHIHLFDAETEETVSPRIPTYMFVDAKVENGKVGFLGTTRELPPAISLEDGEYAMRIPSEAIGFEGDIEATVVKSENIDGKHIAQLNSVGFPLFVSCGENEYKDGAKLNVSVDLKYCSFYQGENEVVKPLDMENSLSGKMVKHDIQKEYTDDKGVTKKRKEIYCEFVIAGVSYICKKDEAIRIITTASRSIFGKHLSFTFNPYQIHVADEGISAKVVGRFDYGNEKFIECEIGEEKPETEEVVGKKKAKDKKEEKVERVIVCVDKDFDAENVKLQLDTDECGVINTKEQIKLF